MLHGKWVINWFGGVNESIFAPPLSNFTCYRFKRYPLPRQSRSCWPTFTFVFAIFALATEAFAIPLVITLGLVLKLRITFRKNFAEPFGLNTSIPRGCDWCVATLWGTRHHGETNFEVILMGLVC